MKRAPEFEHWLERMKIAAAEGPHWHGWIHRPTSSCRKHAFELETMTFLSHRSDPWKRLREYTPARIGLGRVGVSQGTKDVLEFAEAHAHARDAVHAVIDVDALGNAFQHAGFDIIRVRSSASSRREFLQRPDLGRRLDQNSALLFSGIWQPSGSRDPDDGSDADGLKRLALVVGDGLYRPARRCFMLCRL